MEEKNYIYGGLWSLFSLSNDLLKSKHIELGWELVLPTIAYLYTNAEKNEPNTQHLWGVGAMLRIANTVKFSENFLATLAYGHNFNLPLSYFDAPSPNNAYKEKGKSAEQQWIQTGVLSLVFHFRFNTTQKI